MKARRIRVYDTVIETYEVLVPVGTNHDQVDEILAEGDFARMAMIDAMKEVVIHRSKMAAGMGYSEPIRMENGQYMQVSPEGRVSIYGPVTAGKVRYEVTETEGLMKEIQPDGKESLVWMDPKAKALFEAQTKVETEDILAEGRLDRAALEGEIKAAMNVAEWDALEAEVDGLTRRDILRQKGYIKDDAERAMRAAADGYLYYVDTKERVYPDIRKDRKAYSAMVLFNPNAEEGEPRWDAFNRNEDQNVINRQIEAGWIPTSISIAAENVEGLLTDRQIVEEFKGADKAAQMMSEVSSLFEGLEKMEGGGVGLRGKATELFARGIGLFSPGMEEAIIQASTGADSQEFYGFRERIKRMANNLVTVYTGEESGRYTDIEREIAKQASSLDVITATPAAVRATLTNLFVLNMMSKMRGQYAMHRSDPTAFPFELDVLDADNLSEVATYILDSTGFRENEDDSTVTAAEIRIVNGMLKDLVSFQKIMVGR